MKKMCLKNFTGFDLCDTVFEYCNYFDYDSIHKLSYYDKALDTISDKIEVEAVSSSYYKNIIVTCNITKFIEKYQNKINKFLKEIYTSNYLDEFSKIKAYKPSKETKFNGEKSELFYYYYFEGFFNDLINGNFSEETYKFIFEIFTGKED